MARRICQERGWPRQCRSCGELQQQFRDMADGSADDGRAGAHGFCMKPATLAPYCPQFQGGPCVHLPVAWPQYSARTSHMPPSVAQRASTVRESMRKPNSAAACLDAAPTETQDWPSICWTAPCLETNSQGPNSSIIRRPRPTGTTRLVPSLSKATRRPLTPQIMVIGKSHATTSSPNRLPDSSSEMFTTHSTQPQALDPYNMEHALLVSSYMI